MKATKLTQILLLGMFFWASGNGFLHSQTLTQRIFINPGTYVAIDTAQMPALAYNSDTVFNLHNVVLSGLPGDTLQVTLVNRDTLPHGMALNGTTLATLNAYLDSAILSIPIPASGVQILYDPVDFPKNAYLGAACMLVAEDGSPAHRYFWNLHEFQSTYNSTLSAGASVNWSQYTPDYFMVNGRSYPDTEMDSTAMVMGNVGDTILIHVANTGQAKHGLHFHGYHFRVVSSSKSQAHLNWMKDSMPLESMQTLTLELVPDKPGKYPVHDHNLLSLTGGGVYPYGLMLMLDIQ